MELTDRYIAELPLADGASYAARDDLPGFFVTVGKRKKTFTVQCDVRDDLGRRRTKKAVRDLEAKSPTSLPRFPEKIPWALVKWLFELALAQGELLAAHNLAFMFLHGHGVPQDHAEGFRLLKLAEPLGLSRTFELIAECHEKGWGSPPDAAMATRYRAMAQEARAKEEAEARRGQGEPTPSEDGD